MLIILDLQLTLQVKIGFLLGRYIQIVGICSCDEQKKLFPANDGSKTKLMPGINSKVIQHRCYFEVKCGGLWFENGKFGMMHLEVGTSNDVKAKDSLKGYVEVEFFNPKIMKMDEAD